jgi:hypothetical protein
VLLACALLLRNAVMLSAAVCTAVHPFVFVAAVRLKCRNSRQSNPSAACSPIFMLQTTVVVV